MLSNNEKNQLTQIYAVTCKSFDKILDPDVLRLQIEDLADLDYNAVVRAINQYRLDKKNTYWPRASRIRDLVNPTQSTETLANEAASRIRHAIGAYGWPQPDLARGYIGELGWMIVLRAGGWKYLCENHGLDLNGLTFHAQARDIAKSIIESGKAGLGDLPIGLPSSERAQISNIINLIPNKDFPK